MTTSGIQQPRQFRQTAPAPRVTRYLFYLPPTFRADSGERWPLLLFLHGAGERGSNLDLIRAHGIPRRIDEGENLPCIVASPQCPEGERWSVEALSALLDEIERQYPIDLDRVYVTGMSMGGVGTWDLAITQPDRFAAIAPICGRGEPSRVCAIAHLPVWAFHGSKDVTVPLERSQEMVDALQRCGGNVRLTIYPNAGHDSWTRTYSNPELYMWLFAQRRSAPVSSEGTSREGGYDG